MRLETWLSLLLDILILNYLGDGQRTNYTSSGRFSRADDGNWHFINSPHIRLYQTANYVVNTAVSALHNRGYNVYSVGVFQEYENIPSSMRTPVYLLRKVAEYIASSGDRFFPVADMADLLAAFRDIADEVARSVTDINVFLNGERIRFAQSPIIEDGRVLVPIRNIAEAMGGTVDWDDERGMTSIYFDDMEITSSRTKKLKI